RVDALAAAFADDSCRSMCCRPGMRAAELDRERTRPLEKPVLGAEWTQVGIMKVTRAWELWKRAETCCDHTTDESVTYQLNQDYPARSAIQTITARLESNGWRPLREDFLNPGLPTSVVRGWMHFEDGNTGRPTEVYQWVGQWEDTSKRIVWYILSYDGV